MTTVANFTFTFYYTHQRNMFLNDNIFICINVKKQWEINKINEK